MSASTVATKTSAALRRGKPKGQKPRPDLKVVNDIEITIDESRDALLTDFGKIKTPAFNLLAYRCLLGLDYR